MMAHNLLLSWQTWREAGARLTEGFRVTAPGTLPGLPGSKGHALRRCADGQIQETRLHQRCNEWNGGTHAATHAKRLAPRDAPRIPTATARVRWRCVSAFVAPFSTTRCRHGNKPGCRHDGREDSAGTGLPLQSLPTEGRRTDRSLQHPHAPISWWKQWLQTHECRAIGKGVWCVPEADTRTGVAVNGPASGASRGDDRWGRTAPLLQAQSASTSSWPRTFFDYDEVKTSQHRRSSAKPGWRFIRTGAWHEVGRLPADVLRSPRTRL